MSKHESWTRAVDDEVFPTETVIVEVHERGEVWRADGSLFPGDIVMVSAPLFRDILTQLGYERAET